MKKILALTMGSYIGGTEIVALQVFEILRAKFEIHCLVNGWNDGFFIEELKKINVTYTVHKLGWFHLRKILWTIDSLINLPVALFIFIKHIFCNKYELYYTTTYRPLLLLSPFIRNRVIYHVHELNSKSRISRYCIRRIDKKVTQYIAVSNSVKDDLTDIGIDVRKIKLVYNGVNTSITMYKSVRDSVNIGIVGQISPHKGHRLLFDAFKILYKTNKKIRLIIRGDQKISDFKSELIEFQRINGLDDVVCWKPYTKNLSEIYSEIDVLCVPTIHSESFGLVACEAGAFGIPVVASNSGGLKEVIRDNETGFLVCNNDVDAFMEKLKFLIENEVFRAEMGLNAKRHISLNFSKERFANSIMYLFWQLNE